MTSSRHLLAKTIPFLILVPVFGSLGNVLLGKGMRGMGEIQHLSLSTLAVYFPKIAASVWVWLGLGSLLVFFVSYIVILSWADYSYVLPVTATGYVLAPLLAHLLLGEMVPGSRWLGAVFIFLGVAVVGRTPPTTTGRG
ncbi:MAG TPA: EamA family transporter [Terriglobia bacterium]|nr:EamA family transporter [Terriglobia bacterium]